MAIVGCFVLVRVQHGIGRAGVDAGRTARERISTLTVSQVAALDDVRMVTLGYLSVLHSVAALLSALWSLAIMNGSLQERTSRAEPLTRITNTVEPARVDDGWMLLQSGVCVSSLVCSTALAAQFDGVTPFGIGGFVRML